MRDRMVSFVTVAAGAACVAAAIVMWQMVQTTRASQAALLESQREMVQAVLAELKSPRQAVPEEADTWFPLRVKLVDEAGDSVVGEVRCLGEKIDQSVKTDDQGTADLGSLPAGEYKGAREAKTRRRER